MRRFLFWLARTRFNLGEFKELNSFLARNLHATFGKTNANSTFRQSLSECVVCFGLHQNAVFFSVFFFFLFGGAGAGGSAIKRTRLASFWQLVARFCFHLAPLFFRSPTSLARVKILLHSFFFCIMLFFRPFRERNNFYTVKLKTYNCIVFTYFQHTKLYPFQNLSLGFILKIFSNFRKFQPRYSYKMYSYKKECRSRALMYYHFPAPSENCFKRQKSWWKEMTQPWPVHVQSDSAPLPLPFPKQILNRVTWRNFSLVIIGAHCTLGQGSCDINNMREVLCVKCTELNTG